MDRKSLIILAVMLTVCPTFSANAEVYKCADGKYQADPCDENSQPVDLSGVGSFIKSSDSISQSSVGSNATSDKKKEISTYIEKQRVAREITRLEADRKRVIERRDQRMHELQNGRRYANNNLAGATWQQSLAQEMAAVAQQTDTQVESIDRQIEQLRSGVK